MEGVQGEWLWVWDKLRVEEWVPALLWPRLYSVHDSGVGN